MKKTEAAGVILAAGRSSRMGKMKMLLPLGNETILRQGIITMKSAGVSPIVVVTGRESEAVRKSLENLDVVFVHNAEFADTQMFDSAKLGLAELQGFSGKIFFSPGDAPLYSKATLEKLIEAECSIAVPAHNGKTGHPVCFSADILSEIMSYDGENGMAGALKAAGNICEIEVCDEGILKDADTPHDYEELLKYYDKIHKTV